jgi:hypothetical protein
MGQESLRGEGTGVTSVDYKCRRVGFEGTLMRVLLAGLFAFVLIPAASAQPILKREPHYLAPGAVVYVDTGQCGVGKVMKVTGIMKGISRRKICMSLDPQEATLRDAPVL